ncbi:MAG: phosphoribosylformylglycinamidine synthase [Methylococcales bacterium]
MGSHYQILRFPGPPALSLFKVQSLLLDLQRITVDICQVTAEYIHFVEVDGGFSPQDTEIIQRLLHYGPRYPDSETVGEQFFTLPRPGTISPWSSRATEIVGRCGLDSVERIERGTLYRLDTHSKRPLENSEIDNLLPLIHDRMTEIVVRDSVEDLLFQHHEARPLESVALIEQGVDALVRANGQFGLALSDEEIAYLAKSFESVGRNPTDVELMMFAQANSEHCRHKIFNAGWIIDGEKQPTTLFSMIRNTTDKSPEGVLSAYHDNAAVMRGSLASVFIRNPYTGEYSFHEEEAHILMKVETHNHPTAISPFPGAATGAGGEIRDEGATGRGSHTKAGLVGYSVSNLRIPNYQQPWEEDSGKPRRIASALEIMLEAPIGAAAFNNEFGRPNLCGYFRTFEQSDCDSPNHYVGYHKPIMLAGGMGNIRPTQIEKEPLSPDAPIVVLGGAAMLIGLGGGAASSQSSGAGCEELDFASVQRGNPEMQRRCQEVINHCTAMGEDSPVLRIHDVGAGGLSNAIPEIVHESDRGGCFDIRAILSDDASLSPMQIWCNEAQERFVLAVKPELLETLIGFCKKERCPYAVVGKATEEEHLILDDNVFANRPIDIPMSLLFGNTPEMIREISIREKSLQTFSIQDISIAEAVERVLRLPVVASKSFLIHIGDRSVTGLVARDQLVGPWQVPVADVAVTASGFQSIKGEAMAIGERTPLAIIDAPASGRMAIGEAITNLAAASIKSISSIKLSANWMAAAGSPGEDASLYETVKSVGIDICPTLGIAIPVGKDSLSMKTVWSDKDSEKTMKAPLSLIISAFSPVEDITRTLTPQLVKTSRESVLVLIDLGQGSNRMGGSALATVYGAMGNVCPDLDDPKLLKGFFGTIQALNQQGKLLAYHDRSDGGLFTTVCEMAFAGRTGVSIQLDGLGKDTLEILFNEELGAVIQVADEISVRTEFEKAGLAHCFHPIGSFRADQMISFVQDGQTVYSASRGELEQMWSETSYRLQTLRDNPECAREEFDAILDEGNPGLHATLSFSLDDQIAAPFTLLAPPVVAILREQGVNGHVEMAAAFDAAGFSSIDVHMSELAEGRKSLENFAGFVACGGFSYGDVLGAGEGWAKAILFNDKLREQFTTFFQRQDSFALGVCNGCQMLSNLKELVPGTEYWPHFVRNRSEQFEARVAMVEIKESPSIFFKDMTGTCIPVSVAHGEGRAEFVRGLGKNPYNQGIALCYVDNNGKPTDLFPANPNGSPDGITGLTNTDGRFTIMMPHPERCFRTVQNSWHPEEWPEYGPWMRMFRNARVWVG